MGKGEQVRKYDILISHVIDDFIWNVYEKQTDQIIDSFFFEEDATRFAKFLESGGGFDGLTPAFMLTAVPDPTVNAKFERFLA